MIKHLLFAILAMIASVAQAADLPAPQGDVILTVSGNITHTNGDGVARFDRAMLEDLQQATVTTATPWFDDVHNFSGPLGAAILDAVGAQGATLRVVALNDYAATVPAADLHDLGVVFATHLDTRPMSVREKGPLFLIYPFDDNPDLFDEVYFGRSVWQIARIEVLD
ncbi:MULTISPECIES: hypothetical protein [unclassified Yoonia]|uniref:hypothetical protein n=1 Tax=unclassified Yoonia TaxID=2629118 RepID=UPI002AFF4F6D|nr:MULTISPECIES: hypothetical protein [unclassified Yoonia]